MSGSANGPVFGLLHSRFSLAEANSCRPCINPQSVIRSDKGCKDGNHIVSLVDFGLMTNLGLRADW